MYALKLISEVYSFHSPVKDFNFQIIKKKSFYTKKRFMGYAESLRFFFSIILTGFIIILSVQLW